MYRQVNTKIWHDPKVKALSPKNKLLFLYLLTNNHTHMTGIYYMPIPIIEHETGLKKTEITKGMDTLSIPYLIKYEITSEVVWVVNMLKYQGKSDKVKAAASNQLSSLHKTPLIKDFLDYYNTLSIPYQYPIDTLSIPDHKGIGTGIDLELGIGIGVGGKTELLSGKPKRASTVPDQEWINGLRDNPAYKGIDLERLKGKLMAWCELKGLKPTRSRYLNWLNREEVPLNGGGRNCIEPESVMDRQAKILREVGDELRNI